MHNRLFTFGCSFTRYKWPTWADALAPQYNQHYNFAQGGAGNSFIVWSIAEAHARHNITSTDTVIVMWTSRDREDHYADGWQTVGAQDVDQKGSIIRDCANIQLAHMALANTGCDYYFLSMIDLNITDTQQRGMFDTILETYDVLKTVRPSVHNIIYNGDWHNAAFDNDYHPTPQQHIDYLDAVLPELPVDGQTRLQFAAIDKRVRNGRWTADEHWYDGYCVDRF
jgi:hypothetical protein